MGFKEQTSESLTAIDDGVVCARTVRRVPLDRRWSKEKIFGVKLSVAGNGNLGVNPDHEISISGGASGDNGDEVHGQEDIDSGVQFEAGVDSSDQRNAEA